MSSLISRPCSPYRHISSSLWSPEPSTTFEQVFAVTTLAHKYHMESIESQGLAVVKSHFSTKLDAWYERPLFRDYSHIQAIGAINLARLTNTPSILPSAFYACTNFLGIVMNGWKRADGAVERLSEDDLQLVIKGRDALVRWGTVELLQIVTHERSTRCVNRAECDASVRDDTARVLRTEMLELERSFNFEEGKTLVEAMAPLMCRACWRHMSSSVEKRLQEMWKDLPTIMGVAVSEWDT